MRHTKEKSQATQTTQPSAAATKAMQPTRRLSSGSASVISLQRYRDERAKSVKVEGTPLPMASLPAWRYKKADELRVSIAHLESALANARSMLTAVLETPAYVSVTSDKGQS